MVRCLNFYLKNLKTAKNKQFLKLVDNRSIQKIFDRNTIKIG